MPAADLAYQQAHRIRLTRLGGSNLTTLSTLIPMAELAALPTRAQRDPAKIDAAAALLRQVIEGSAASREPRAGLLMADASAALQRLGAAHPHVLAVARGNPCGDVQLPPDSMIFSGEAAPLAELRTRFTKASLPTRFCGAVLVFPMGPGVDPTPILDLLADISAGRFKGVRVALIENRAKKSR